MKLQWRKAGEGALVEWRLYVDDGDRPSALARLSSANAWVASVSDEASNFGNIIGVRESEVKAAALAMLLEHLCGGSRDGFET